MISEMNVDIETYSDVDLTKTGVYTYAASPNFEILLIGYCLDGGPVEVIDLTDPDTWPGRLPEFTAALTDPAVIKTAYNANFERTCLAAWFKTEMPPEQWRCTAVHAATLGLPPALGAVGQALGLPEDKQKDKVGKSLIQYFCKPCRPTKANGGRTRNLPEHDPEKWKLFIEYNRQDVVTERAVREKLLPYKIPPSEQVLWTLDQQMNDRGVRVDMRLVDNILEYDAVYQDKLMEEARRITGLPNPNSLTQLKQWLLDEFGVKADSITKDTLPGLMERLKDEPEGLRMMQIRAELGKTSTKKYAAMKNAVCPDGRLRGILQFYGANRTGRWAGRIVQVHNLPQNKIPDIGLARDLAEAGEFDFMQDIFDEGIPFIFSQLVRTAFVPSKGCRFVVADFSAIEARVIAWLAGEEWVLDAFRAGKDIYCETASRMYHVPVEKHGVNGHLRQKGKIATLACGYQGGVGAMKAMDKSGTIPESEMQGIVDDWRRANPHIVKLWWDYEAAAKTAIKEQRKVKRCIRRQADNLSEREHMAGGAVRPYSKRENAPDIIFEYSKKHLFVTLPSGRKLCYWNARLEEGDDGREHICFDGIDQTSRTWGVKETYGGKIAENCLAEGTQVLTSHGIKHIEDVTTNDLLWDGTEWVRHEGLIHKGIQKTICINGVWMTPDHMILTKEGWIHASQSERHYTNGKDVSRRSRGSIRPELYDNALPHRSWVADRFVIYPCGCKKQSVYDLKNAGPDHRFAVISDAGLMIVHNCTQAVARDCLAEIIKRVTVAGYQIVMHVHDEIICDVPNGSQADLDHILAEMRKPISWAPGLPLKGDGYITDFYKKD